MEESAKFSQAVEIDKVLSLQRSHALSLRDSDYRQRLAVLDRFEKVFRASFGEIYRASFADFSKSEAEVDFTEIFTVLSELKHIRKNLRSWMKSKNAASALTMFGTSAKIISEPRGVCLVVSPWNYPFNLTFCPMMLAIAAGNTVIIKPSELTPNMSKVICDIVGKAFTPEEVAAFQGDASTASYLTSLPVDHIFFTGSPSIGRRVMAAAAENLTSITLELGGKSPVVIDHTADLKKAAGDIVFGKFMNNGQTCIAPDYIYVEGTVKETFIEEMKKSILSQYGPFDSLPSNSDYCRIVNDLHFERLKRLLDDARQQGGVTIFGGKCDAESKLIEPTLLEGMAESSLIMQEEIFGPILPMITFTDMDDVLSDINSRPKPLALYVYSNEKSTQNKVIQRTSAGDSCINQIAIHFMHPNLPFGGVNNSGLGKTGGRWGFEAFSHQRSVLEDKLGAAAFLRPPYTPRIHGMIKNAIKFFT
jgi:aldehyde dehydrogenase (NAD+)